MWVITRRDSARNEVDFVMTAPKSTIETSKIRLREAPDGMTAIHIGCTFTALTDHGDAFIEAYPKEHFRSEDGRVGNGLESLSSDG